MNSQQSKGALRAELRTRRAALNARERRENSTAIAGRLAELRAFRAARSVGIYMAMDEEADCAPIVELALARGKSCYLPAIVAVRWRSAPMLFRDYRPGVTRLRANRYGISEPQGRPGSGIAGTSLDLVVTPVVGFNLKCERIGMGGGYYDQTFPKRAPATRSVTLVGIAFDCQEASFAAASHDTPLDYVVTETRVLTRRARPYTT